MFCLCDKADTIYLFPVYILKHILLVFCMGFAKMEMEEVFRKLIVSVIVDSYQSQQGTLLPEGRSVFFMKHIKMSKVKVIQSDSAADFEDRLNEALTEVCELNSSYSIHFNMSMGHCAYIEYSYTQSIPENLADEYDLRGERFYCGNCPRFIPSMDGRSRYGTCGYGVVKRPLPSDSACNTFYTNYENGTWKAR